MQILEDSLLFQINNLYSTMKLEFFYITMKISPTKRTKLNIVDIHLAIFANKSLSYLKESGTAGNKNMSE